MIHMYLDRVGVAERIGVKPDSLSRYRLPPPDAVIGCGPKARKGWLPKTIDAWNAARPGRGWWGETPKGKRRGGRRPLTPAFLPGGINEIQEQRMEDERRKHEAESEVPVRIPS